jgi:hypothetical protein
MMGGRTCFWNQRVFLILLEKFKEGFEPETLPSDEYILDMFGDKFKRLSVAWNQGKTRTTADGRVETSEETEMRIVRNSEVLLKTKRQTTRRHNVSTQSVQKPPF